MHQPNPWTSLRFQTNIRYARCLISAGGLCLVASEPAKWMGKRDDYISEDFGETRNGLRTFCASVIVSSSASSDLLSFIGLLRCRQYGIESPLAWHAVNKVSKGCSDSVAGRSDRAQSSMMGGRLS
jgi:hypothetical protein